MPAKRTADWQPRAGAHWEGWSLNGEVIVTGLVPPLPGDARLAHCLTWVLREFASHSHALWRLPCGMAWRGPDGERWMRYPVVSFVVAVRPLRPTG